jgi:hypothetical protein
VSLNHAKGYPSAEAAAMSKAVVQFGHEIVLGCPCGEVHVRKPLEPGRKPFAQSPAGQADGISPKVRKLVLERDGYSCVCCGRSIFGQRYSLGHRVRAAQGGPATPVNLITLLGWGGESHHGRIDLFKDPDDGIGVKGYRLPSNADPAMEPVLIVSAEGADYRWLTADGKYAFKAPEGSVAA